MVSMADARGCPRTIPVGSEPSTGTYGNGKLKVGLWTRGVISVKRGSDYVDREGRVRMKFPWWRYVSGALHITGHRLETRQRLRS